MGKNRRAESGFGAIEVVVIVLILIIVGMVGWYVLTHNKDDSKNNANQSTNSNQTADWSQKSNNDQPALAISNWGVEVPNAGEKFSLEAGSSSSYYINLTTSVPSCPKTIVGSINRERPDDVVTEEDFPSGPAGKTWKEVMHGNGTVTLGGYIYWFQPPQAACSGSDEDAAKQSAATKEFKVLFSNLRNAQ